MHNILTNVPAASQQGRAVFLLKLFCMYLDKKPPQFRNVALNKSIHIGLIQETHRNVTVERDIGVASSIITMVQKRETFFIWLSISPFYESV